MRIDFHENLVHRINVVFETFVRNIYYMNQQISLANFVKRRFERFYQLSRQFSDETNRICQQNGKFPITTLRTVVSSVAKVYFLQNFRFRKRIHQSRFSNVGISYQRNSHHFSTIISLSCHLFINGFQLFFRSVILSRIIRLSVSISVSPG